ncbi:Protein sprouty like protein 4 [Fukomys damarensis]|uniref:Protein sprouty like protein 4 n=1 Tax=Fukomys damarensis TaxID=885580 RepID=A0A091DUM6_FUKDA|nr:Protein sprouty like protein 4 [Fukomys damarensis]
MESPIPQSVPLTPSLVMVQPLLDGQMTHSLLQRPLTILPMDQMKKPLHRQPWPDTPRPPQPQVDLGWASLTPACGDQDVTHRWIYFSGRPISVSSSSSTSSDQRLLDHMAPPSVAEQASLPGRVPPA